MKEQATGGATSEACLATPIESDYAAWLLAQARALRQQRPHYLDWEKLAEELEGMARNEERALESYLAVFLHHVLKYRYEASKISGSREASIENSRADRQAYSAFAKP